MHNGILPSPSTNAAGRKLGACNTIAAAKNSTAVTAREATMYWMKKTGCCAGWQLQSFLEVVPSLPPSLSLPSLPPFPQRMDSDVARLLLCPVTLDVRGYANMALVPAGSATWGLGSGGPQWHAWPAWLGCGLVTGRQVQTRSAH